MGFIGPVGEAGLAGEKVNNLFHLCPDTFAGRETTEMTTCCPRLHTGGPRGDGPSWTTWRKGDDGETQ